MIENEGRAVVVQAAAKTMRWQRERVASLVARRTTAGMTAREISQALAWPLDSAQHWIEELLNLGELVIRPGDALATEPFYITTEHLAPATSPDGVA